jgi:hypothetical protein
MMAAVFYVALALAAMGALGMITVPIGWLVGLGFVLQVRQGFWQVGGVMFDSFDLGLGCLVLALALRGVRRGSLTRLVPRLAPWLWLAVLISASYATSPSGQSYMTDPVRDVYQLYRYAIRFVVLYPIACLAFDSPRKFDQVLTGIVLAADVCAVMAIGQGYHGEVVRGPFVTKNVLGGVLAVPIVIVLVDIMRGRQSLFTIASAALLLRGALFAASRGAFAGIIVGTATAWWFLHRGRVRTRVLGLAAGGVLALGLLIAVKPDLLHRPTIAKFFTTFDPGQENLSWRIHERWPYFTRRALQHPWLGWGSDVDLTLGPKANTPHNGYLGLANYFGFPVLALYLVFSVTALRDAWTVARRGRDPADRVRAATIGGGIACILTHNLVDSVVLLTFVGGELWVFAAVAATVAARGRTVRAERTAPAPARPALAVGAGS